MKSFRIASFKIWGNSGVEDHLPVIEKFNSSDPIFENSIFALQFSAVCLIIQWNGHMIFLFITNTRKISTFRQREHYLVDMCYQHLPPPKPLLLILVNAFSQSKEQQI